MLEPESTAVWVGQEWGGGGGIGTHGNKRPKKVALASPYTYVRMMSVYSVGVTSAILFTTAYIDKVQQ